MIPPDLAFVLIAGLAFIGFVIDALFDRLRVTSVLPLMLIGIALLYLHVLPVDTIAGLNALVPFITGLTVAFILFHVGLGIRAEDLSRVLGRSLGFTLAVQVGTGVVISLLAWWLFRWDLAISFVFGFGLSGPSSISVPVLVRVARMPEAVKTSLLFESVMSDLLQLLVPLMMVGLIVSGNFSTVHIGEVLALTILGSAVAGVAAAIAWLWILDQIGSIAREYSWTLTITMVLATYGIADYLGLSAAITVFVFGLMVGNRSHLTFDPFARRRAAVGATDEMIHGLRRALRLSVVGVDVEHIQQVQKEVSFFASAFFFVYIGLLFQAESLAPIIVAVPLVASFLMLVVRWMGTPILDPYFSRDERARRSERSLVAFNIPRGLAAAIIATIPLSYGIVIPGFLDAMFLGILFSTVISTVGIFLYYSPGTPSEPAPSGANPSRLLLGSGTAAPARRPAPGPAETPEAPGPPAESPPPLPVPRAPRPAR